MTKDEVMKLVAKYTNDTEPDSNENWMNHTTQYDDQSAKVNYAFIRHFKPVSVVEFGSRTGRCTHDILQALLKNGKKFTFKSYELEDGLRETAQNAINGKFADKAITIGGDVTKAKDLPKNIDYLFIDNYHDTKTTEWVFDKLLKRCKPGCIVQFHDLYAKGDIEFENMGVPEVEVILKLKKENKLPLKKLFFYWENSVNVEHPQRSSAWFVYEPIK